MSQAPPPPPPHGDNPRTTAGGAGLPTGKYDIFIIPEHSAGSGFLYLPSLKPRWNSFMAGVACTIAGFVIGNSIAPALRAWWTNFQGLGNMGMVLLVIAVGLGSWSFGRTQVDGASSGSGPYQSGTYGGGSGSGAYYNTPPPNAGPRPSQAPPPNPPPPPPPPQPETPKHERPNQSWQDQPQTEQPRPQAQQPPPPPPEPEWGQPKPQPKPQPQSQPRQASQPQPQPRQTPQPTPPRPSPTKTDAKGAWEKAREETRRREEERKTREAELKRKEDAARRLRELREREAREREQREKDSRSKETKEKERKEQEARDRARLEKEVRDKVERELREKAQREAREREAKEREAKEAKEREEREREAKQRAAELLRMREEERQRVETERRERETREAREREAKEARERKERLERLEKERIERERQRKDEEDKNARKGSSYAFSSMGEKTSMWPNGKPPAASQAASSPGTAKPASPSPTKPAATSERAAGTEEEAYSFRPYDKPKKPAARKKSVSDFSESSWAPSASTARTTPPPSMRGPYTTDDHRKIIIKAVYVFLNQFSKTPAMQLVSGCGSVTDGLIMRITSAGIFVDDDVRSQAQRDWDIKAWTIKQIEVWCPTHALNSAASNTPGSVPTNHPFYKHMPSTARRAAERGATKTFIGEEAVAYLAELGRGCQDTCQRGLSASAKTSVSGNSNNSNKSGEWASKGLHVLRVNIRDQEGKRYLFVIEEEQSPKISMGLQNLRGGSQVRSLGFAGLSGLEAKSILETLGWS